MMAQILQVFKAKQIKEQFKRNWKILTKLNSFEPVILQGSGRTDSGVHAFGQVIHFDLKGKVRDLERLRFGLDTQTPADIAVKKWNLSQMIGMQDIKSMKKPMSII